MHRRLSAILAAATLAAPAGAEVFDCVINPAVTVRLGASVTGLLDEVLVDQGDIVAPGQLVARLSSGVERTTVEVLEVQAGSRSEVEAQEARLTLSEQRLARLRQMVERNIAPREELETAEAETEVVRRELAIAEMRQKVAALELERARRQLEQREIRSPVEGVVVSRALFTGEFLAQDAHVVTIASLDPLHVEAFLPVAFFGSVEPGMTLAVLPDPPAKGSHDATVEVVDRVFDAASGTFGIRLRLPNPDLAIPAGHRCVVEVPASVQRVQ